MKNDVLRNFIIGLLTIALIAVGVWGVNQKEEKEALMITAENNYQRAFHELAFHIDQIEDQLGTTIAMNTRRQLSPSLADVWRVTSLAQEEMGQLPLNSVDLDQTKEFLFKLGKFAYSTSIRDLDREPLTDNEYETLKQLYNHAKGIRGELRKTQAQMLSKGERWLNIDQELRASNEKMDNTVMSNFEVMNKSIEGFSETEWGVNLAEIENINGELKKALTGKEISKEQALRIAHRYLQIDQEVPMDIEELGEELEYPAYSISANDPDHGTYYHMDISKKGGEPIWFLQDRQIEEQNISLNEASERAKQYLKKMGKDNMQLVDSKQYDSVATLEFSYVQDNVRIYPDTIHLQVALDDGDILSYEAKDYLINHRKRDIPKPKLTDEEARKKVNPNVEIMEDHLTLIKNDLDEEVLCYEFIGVIDNDTYRIFINALDGSEEKVEREAGVDTIY